MISQIGIDHLVSRAAVTDPLKIILTITSLIVAGLSWLVIKPNLVEYRLPKLSIVLQDKISSVKERSREYTKNSSGVLKIGYKKFPDEPFGLTTTEGTNIVIPLKYLDYIRGQKGLSFSAFLDEEFAFKPYTKLGNLDQEEINVLTKKLNPTLPQYVPVLKDLVREYWPLDKPDTYTSIKLYYHVHLMTSRISARVFNGSDAAGDDRWLHIATNYIHLATVWTARLREWPIYLRPVIYRWVSGWDDLVRDWVAGRALVGETVQKKRALGNKPLNDPPSFLDWLTDPRENPKGADDMEKQVIVQMQLCVAAIQSMTATVMQCLIDLATYHHFVPEIREEIRQVMDNYDGEITKQGLSDMLKLDSFIKESGRLNPPDLTSFQRKATTDVHLSNGMFIPKGAKLILPSVSINVDEAIYEDPNTFDGLRFYKIRTSKPENRNSHQLVSVGKKDIAWGYGKHACPGRFLADIAAKIVIIEFILNYDLRTPKGMVGRPPNIEVEGVAIPDPNGELLIRRVGVVE